MKFRLCSWLSIILAISVNFLFPVSCALDVPAAQEKHYLIRAMASVVSIAVQGNLEERDGSAYSGDKFQTMGSGVVINSKGIILTNAHVVNASNVIVVSFNNGRKALGKIISSNNALDLAIIKVNLENIPQIKLADSNKLKIGDRVTAIGNPFGLHQTVTSGVISALHRSGVSRGISDYIQTDASINPGNSGGALINQRGELVGINTAILSPYLPGNIGIGFAIPINIADYIIKQIMEYGDVKPAMLGILGQNMSPELASLFHVGSNQQGVLITSISPNSGAEAAGLQPKDIILGLNNINIVAINQLQAEIHARRKNTKITLNIMRKNKILALPVNLKLHESDSGTTEKKSHNPFKGVEFIETAGVNIYGKTQNGLRVLQVNTGTQAWLSGLIPGDILEKINEKRIINIAELNQFISSNTEHCLLEVSRMGKPFFIALS